MDQLSFISILIRLLEVQRKYDEQVHLPISEAYIFSNHTIYIKGQQMFYP